MPEYLLIVLLVIFAGSTAFLAREHYLKPRRKGTSHLYTQGLRDLLDAKPEAAFAKLRQVVGSEPDNIDAYLRLGQILREHNQPDRALQIHKDLTLRSNLARADKISILRQLVLNYLALNDAVTAEAASRELLSLDSRDRWAHSRLLEIQEAGDKWEDAFGTASTILKLDSDKSRKSLARYKFRIGEAFCLTKEYHKARVAFKEAISIDQTFVPAYLAMGDAFYQEKRFEDAVTFWNKLIKVVPSQGHMAIARLQRTLFELGRFGDIADICENVLRHDPRNAGARKTLAEFHEKKGDLLTAVEMFESLVDDYPNDAIVVVDLARLYAEQGDQKKLEKLLRRIEQNKEQAQSSSAGNKTSSAPSTVGA